MKLNGALLLILISLGIFTYYFQEVGDQNKIKRDENRGMIFDPSVLGALEGIKTPKAMIQKVGSSFLIGEHMILVDSRKLDKFFEALSHVKIKEVLPPVDKEKRKFFFPSEESAFHFSFEHGEIRFLLGAKLAYGREFYVEIKKGKNIQHVIAFDSSPIEGVYSSYNSHRIDYHYRKLSSLLYLREDFFYDGRVFKKEKLGSELIVKSIDVSNFRNKSFSLDFQNKLTGPRPPKGVFIDEKYIEKILHDIRKLEGKTLYYPYKKENLKELLCNIKLFGSKNLELKLYRKNGSLNGYFLQVSHDSSLFELDKESASLFFSHVQDYWDLRLVGDMGLDNLKIKFSKKWYSVGIRPGQHFEVRNLDDHKRRPRHKAFEKLWKLLSTRAQRLAYLEKNAQLGKKLFSLSFGNKIFHVKLEGGEVHLVNLEDGYELIYLVGDDVPIEKTMNDYFL